MVEDLAIREVMTRDYVGASESDTVRDAAQLMLDEHQAAIAVLRGTDPVGVVLERQVLGVLLDGGDPDETSLDTIMQRPPSVLPPDTGIAEAAGVLADAQTDHVFVGHDDELIGVLSENDLITAVTSLLTTESSIPFDESEAATQRMESGGGTNTMETSQSVCESCGIFKPDLELVNGQLLCVDCRSV